MIGLGEDFHPQPVLLGVWVPLEITPLPKGIDDGINASRPQPQAPGELREGELLSVTVEKVQDVQGLRQGSIDITLFLFGHLRPPFVLNPEAKGVCSRKPPFCQPEIAEVKTEKKGLKVADRQSGLLKSPQPTSSDSSVTRRVWT